MSLVSCREISVPISEGPLLEVSLYIIWFVHYSLSKNPALTFLVRSYFVCQGHICGGSARVH